VLLALAVLAFGGTARANGRYPAASLIVFEPNHPEHIAVSVTFGLLESYDGGKSFAWRCESALRSSGQQDLMVAIAGNGGTVTAKFDGIATSTDGCSFYFPPELMDRNMGDLTISRSVPDRLLAFYLDSRLEGGFDSQIVRSDDDGHSWTDLGSPLSTDLLPLTIDVAPSDDSRVYVSARLDGAGNFASTLLRSTDGGVTFTRADIPETEEHHLAYIAGVNPTNPDCVYLRVYSADGTRLWMSDDGGVTFHKVFTGTDQIYGFAFSPDGAHIAFGGPGDGVWTGSFDGSGLTRVSDLLPTCLGWSDDGIFLCADQMTAPFSIGRSRDFGSTFDTVLRFDTLCGQTACGPETDCGKSCPHDWDIVGPAVGATCGLVDAGAPDAPDVAAVPDAPSDQSVEADVPPSAAADAQPESAPPRRDAQNEIALEASGGGCAVHPMPQRGNPAALLILLLATSVLHWRAKGRFRPVMTNS
jgi:hypothetical protein